jgi:dipeptidyl aminopeptidase/acylaminoacyl peptidase
LAPPDGCGRDAWHGPAAVRTITDKDRIAEILRSISPIEVADSSAAPTMVIQGEKDQSVPPEKTARFVARLQELGVPSKLVVVSGAGHKIPDASARSADLADWFDTYLLKGKSGR